MVEVKAMWCQGHGPSGRLQGHFILIINLNYTRPFSKSLTVLDARILFHVTRWPYCTFLCLCCLAQVEVCNKRRERKIGRPYYLLTWFEWRIYIIINNISKGKLCGGISSLYSKNDGDVSFISEMLIHGAPPANLQGKSCTRISNQSKPRLISSVQKVCPIL